MTLRSLRMAACLAALSAAAPVAIAWPAMAAEETTYSAAAFADAQSQDKPILVEIAASWCPICARQRPILEKLAADPAFKDLTILKVDFDSQKDVVRSLGAQMQSTLIVFHGKTERGRSTGDTRAESIRALLEKASA